MYDIIKVIKYQSMQFNDLEKLGVSRGNQLKVFHGLHNSNTD